MTLLWLAQLLACGGGSELPEGPDPAATKAAIDNLCKLYEGARMSCERRDGELTGGGLPVRVEATYDALEERLGVTTFRGTVTLTTSQHTWVTRMSGYGSGRDEAIQRGLHEWALVEGIAFVDASADATERPALLAVEPGIAIQELVAGGRPVYRGWTLQRPPLEGGIDHAALVRAATKAVSLDAGPHMLRIEVARNLGELAYTCFLDGKPHEAMCASVKGYPWPDVAAYEVRQTYAIPASGKL